MVFLKKIIAIRPFSTDIFSVFTSQVHGNALARLSEAALDRRRISGWTHNFYRYPARFSPAFAAEAIRLFSRRGDVVLDPYMGGGTVVVESLSAGRRVIGNDLNSLATFVAKVKVTALDSQECAAVRRWAEDQVPRLSYRLPAQELTVYIDLQKTRNLKLVRARFIKKVMAAALGAIQDLPTGDAQDFARCVLLRVGQWALDGRGKHTPLRDFREKLIVTTHVMLAALGGFVQHIESNGGSSTLFNRDASTLDELPFLRDPKNRASLVVTSPPYPGVHVLYHRWQVDGRRETPAPYWIAGCQDGQGASYYNFGDQRQGADAAYFESSLRTLKAIHRTMRKNGRMIQMLAFSRPETQLPMYLENMRAAGFAEMPTADLTRTRQVSRIWRDVPNRKWHASLNGFTHSAKEVILLHVAT